MKSVHSFVSQHAKIGILIIRITLGGVFLFHGISKLSNMDGTIAFFGSLGFSSFLAWLVAILETIAGAAIVLGIWVRHAVIITAIILIVAIIKVKSGKGFSAMEIDVVLLGLSIGLLFLGCGSYSMCCMGHQKKCSDTTCTADCGCVCKKNH